MKPTRFRHRPDEGVVSQALSEAPCLCLAPPDGAAHGTLHRTPLEGAQLPALRTPPALSFYVLRVEYLVWAGSPERYVRKIEDFSFLKKNKKKEYSNVITRGHRPRTRTTQRKHPRGTRHLPGARAYPTCSTSAAVVSFL